MLETAILRGGTESIAAIRYGSAGHYSGLESVLLRRDTYVPVLFFAPRVILDETGRPARPAISRGAA